MRAPSRHGEDTSVGDDEHTGLGAASRHRARACFTRSAADSSLVSAVGRPPGAGLPSICSTHQSTEHHHGALGAIACLWFAEGAAGGAKVGRGAYVTRMERAVSDEQ